MSSVVGACLFLEAIGFKEQLLPYQGVCIQQGRGPAQSACVCHQFLYKNTNILTTVHAMRQLFIPFCSAQDGESADMNCFVFWAHCENGKILTKCQVL